MRTRRKAREAALQALYQCDSLNEFEMDGVQYLFSQLFSEELKNPEFKNKNYSFCVMLVSLAIDSLEEVNRAISTASTRWSLQRMARVDRNILRLAVAEILYCDDIPVNVSINEAIEIAKRFGTEDSAQFINGLLDKVAENARSNTQRPASLKAVNQ